MTWKKRQILKLLAGALALAILTLVKQESLANSANVISRPIIFRYDFPNNGRVAVQTKYVFATDEVFVITTSVNSADGPARLEVASKNGEIAATFIKRQSGYFGFTGQAVPLPKRNEVKPYDLWVRVGGHRTKVGTMLAVNGERAAYRLRSGKEDQYVRSANRVATCAVATVPCAATGGRIGTGILISRTGVVATAAHVVGNDPTVKFSYRDKDFSAARVTGPDADHFATSYDLAFFTVAPADIPPGGFLTVALAQFRNIAEVRYYSTQEDDFDALGWFLLGYPAVQRSTLSTFSIDNYSIKPYTDLTQSDASQTQFHHVYTDAIIAGLRGTRAIPRLDAMSGGPLLVENGYVLGLFTGSRDTGGVESGSVYERAVCVPITLVKEGARRMRLKLEQNLLLQDSQINMAGNDAPVRKEIVAGLNAYVADQLAQAATHFTAVLTLQERANTQSKLAADAGKDIAVQLLAQIGPQAVPAILQVLRDRISGANRIDDNTFASLLDNITPYGGVPRDIIAYSLTGHGGFSLPGDAVVQPRSTFLVLSGVRALSLLKDVQWLNEPEYQALLELADTRQSRFRPLLTTTSAVDVFGIRRTSLIALAQLVYNPFGERHKATPMPRTFPLLGISGNVEKDVRSGGLPDFVEGGGHSSAPDRERDVRAFLIDTIRSDDEINAVRFPIARVIRDGTDKRALEELQAALAASNSEKQKQNLTDVIGEVGFEEGVIILQNVLLDSKTTAGIRHHALIALSKIPTPGAFTVLARVLRTQMSQSAASALARIGSLTAIQELANALVAPAQSPPSAEQKWKFEVEFRIFVLNQLRGVKGVQGADALRSIGQTVEKMRIATPTHPLVEAFDTFVRQQASDH